MKIALLAAVTMVSLGLTEIAQAGPITGFSLVSQNADAAAGNGGAGWVNTSSLSFTSTSVSFDTYGIGNSVGHPWEAIFQIDSSSPLTGAEFLACADVPTTSNPCVQNYGLNVFTSGFHSSGDTATINNTVEWSDPVGLTGVVDPRPKWPTTAIRWADCSPRSTAIS